MRVQTIWDDEKKYDPTPTGRRERKKREKREKKKRKKREKKREKKNHEVLALITHTQTCIPVSKKFMKSTLNVYRLLYQ